MLTTNMIENQISQNFIKPPTKDMSVQCELIKESSSLVPDSVKENLTEFASNLGELFDDFMQHAKESHEANSEGFGQLAEDFKNSEFVESVSVGFSNFVNNINEKINSFSESSTSRTQNNVASS